MDAWNLMLVREFRDPFHDLSIGLSRGVVLASRDLIGFGPKRALRRPVARQSPGGERAIRNHSDLLLAAERQHLPLLFAVDQVRDPASRQSVSSHASRRRAAPSGTATRTWRRHRC